MCPALMFAASRNDRVIGRIMILVDSISTRKGFSHSGAPSGSRCAVVALMFQVRLDIISASQRGRPKDSVKIRWLEVLNL
jgi:hypothetical protein